MQSYPPPRPPARAASSSGSSKESDNAAFGALDKVLASLERPDANSNGLSSAVAAAAANRLRFRRLVHQALLRLAGKARCDLESAAKLLEKAEKALAGIRESAALSEGGLLRGCRDIDPGFFLFKCGSFLCATRTWIGSG